MVVHTLSDRPLIHQSEKITIKKGCITKEKVWKDNYGNELEHVGFSKFILKSHVSKPNTPQRSTQEDPLIGSISAKELFDDTFLDMMLFFCFTLLLVSIFLLGYCIGIWRVRKYFKCFPSHELNEIENNMTKMTEEMEFLNI